MPFFFLFPLKLVSGALLPCQLHGDLLIQCQISWNTTFQPSSLERGFLEKANCCIQSETLYGFIVAYLFHNGSYCMFNEEICLMLQIRFCKPALLYQNMLLLVMPDIDFKLYLPPRPQKIKTKQKKPRQNLRQGLYNELLGSKWWAELWHLNLGC